jgi:NADPH:quinone reductase-like Zn-dependent oxidoreductase
MTENGLNFATGSKAAVGHTELRLALDGVSGPATGVLAATLSPRGTLVSFAAMSSNPMSISPLDVIFKPVAAQAAEMIASGQVRIPVAATYDLSSIKEAVAHAQRGGKVLLDIARKDGGSKP